MSVFSVFKSIGKIVFSSMMEETTSKPYLSIHGLHMWYASPGIGDKSTYFSLKNCKNKERYMATVSLKVVEKFFICVNDSQIS